MQNSEQKKYDKVEDAINELLDGELQENALKLAAYLNENQLKSNMSAWGKFTYNGYNIGRMTVEKKINGNLKSLIIFTSVISPTRTENLQKRFTTTLIFATRPVMTNVGEPKTSKFSEKSSKACVRSIPVLL